MVTLAGVGDAQWEKLLSNTQDWQEVEKRGKHRALEIRRKLMEGDCCIGLG